MSKKRRAREGARNPAGMSKNVKAFLFLSAVIGGTLLVLTVIFLPWIVPAVRHAVFAADVKRYLEEPAGTDDAAGAHVKGKVVVLCRGTRQIDTVHTRLPAELRAYSAAEVGTVIWLDWDFEAVQGGRWGGTTSHFSTCNVTVIDHARNVVLGRTKVMGASSPVSRGSRYGPAGVMTATRCNDQVVGYITGLPRR